MISAKWLENVRDPAERDRIIEVLQNPFLRDNFLAILDRIEAEEERLELDLDGYADAAWAYRQADLNGAKRAYRKIRTLFKLKESKTNG